VQENLAAYAPTLKLQKGYDDSHKNPGKYAITGGAKPKEPDLITNEEYLKSISSVKTDEYDSIKSYKLGYVGEYKRLLDARRSDNNNNSSRTANADHIPPKNSVGQAWNRIKDKPELREQLKNRNPKLYEMIEGIKDDNNGRNLVAMEVLAVDHRCALTTASSQHAKKSRQLIAESLVSGDVERMLKQSMILAHPVTSQELLADLGEARRPPHNLMSQEGTRGYYKAGFTNLVTAYSRQGLIDQNQKEWMMEWTLQGFLVGLLWIVSVLIDGEWWVCCMNDQSEQQLQLACKDKRDIKPEEEAIIAELKNDSRMQGLGLFICIILLASLTSLVTSLKCSKDKQCCTVLDRIAQYEDSSKCSTDLCQIAGSAKEHLCKCCKVLGRIAQCSGKDLCKCCIGLCRIALCFREALCKCCMEQNRINEIILQEEENLLEEALKEKIQADMKSKLKACLDSMKWEDCFKIADNIMDEHTGSSSSDQGGKNNEEEKTPTPPSEVNL
ncbi:uncharacterized protein LOC122981723 isoform X2, partial [Scomber scombrus]